jgi:hypothetical protein
VNAEHAHGCRLAPLDKSLFDPGSFDMSARRGSSFATVLLLVPVAAIPLMAFFGVPEFDRLSASTEELIPDIVRQPSLSFVEDDPATAKSASNAHRDSASDLLAPVEAEAAEPSSPDDSLAWSRDPADDNQAESGLFAPRAAVAPIQKPLPRPLKTSAVAPPVTVTGAAEAYVPPPATESGLSWREATRRLKEIGITEYRLDNHPSTDQFLFVCHFSPGGDARIVQRFEADGDEPLEAVEDVLAQVDHWLQHRHQESRQWLK